MGRSRCGDRVAVKPALTLLQGNVLNRGNGATRHKDQYRFEGAAFGSIRDSRRLDIGKTLRSDPGQTCTKDFPSPPV
ncbi:MAG: hypothetical protein JWM61_3080 [Micrococcaceae bacterium]|jgi:hypothetical protein|nr:hypothetical protein [Micrococcaceae bacterium]